MSATYHRDMAERWRKSAEIRRRWIAEAESNIPLWKRDIDAFEGQAAHHEAQAARIEAEAAGVTENER